uniref:EF-hand domain-containing protein n=1 Tax=Salix viminalis TaxID=40686 RepID=A0A6N2MMJ4_SALVM
MSINRSVKNMAKGGMSMEEFKAWVLRDLDADQDGRISKDELADFLRRNGEWFPNLKARRWTRSADSNRNGVFDEIENIGKLEEFYQKYSVCKEVDRSAKWIRGMDSGDGKHGRKKMSDRGIDLKWNSQNNDFTEHITEAGLPSAPAKKVELKKAFNHFGLFFPHHAATVFDAKKEGSVKLTELDDLVNSAVRLGYTVN